MKIGLVTDVHANVLALEAALAAIRREGVDAIYSLGDQINLGPCPRETMELLRAHGVHCLHGNHERYVLTVMAGKPGYDAVNFRSLHFNARLMRPEEITFPKTAQVGSVTLCHALPDDDRFPVTHPSEAIPLLRERNFGGPVHFICGHGHNPRYYRVGDVTVSCIGSTGAMDNGIAGMASYSILAIDGEDCALMSEYASYDPRPLKAMFRRSGMPDFCPVMAHIACEGMMRNVSCLVPFMTKAWAMARARGESEISARTWADCDAAFDWPGGVSTAEYWK